MQSSRLQTQDDESSIRPVRLQSIDDQEGHGPTLFEDDFSLISGVKVSIEVVIGRAEISIQELFSLKEKSTIKLDETTESAVTVCLNGKPIARGNLVVVGDNFGVCIEEIIPVKEKT